MTVILRERERFNVTSCSDCCQYVQLEPMVQRVTRVVIASEKFHVTGQLETVQMDVMDIGVDRHVTRVSRDLTYNSKIKLNGIAV